MGLQYVVVKHVFGFNKDENMKYVAKSVGSGELSTDKLYAKVGRALGIHRKTVDLVATGFVGIMSEEIENGKTACLGNFGLFRPSFVGECADTQEGVTTSNIARKRILFFSGKAFSAMPDKMNITRMAMSDTDYADDSQGNEGKPGNPDMSDGGEEGGPLGQNRVLRTGRKMKVRMEGNGVLHSYADVF